MVTTSMVNINQEQEVMSSKVIGSSLHGVLDYLLAISCITYSWLSGLYLDSPGAFYVSIGCSVFFVMQALFTQFKPSIFKVIPMNIHLWNDLCAAGVFLITPFVFGLTGLHMIYFIAVAIGIIYVGFKTRKDDLFTWDWKVGLKHR